MEQRGYRHRGTGAVVLAVVPVGGSLGDEFEPISLHDATMQHVRDVAALHDEGDRLARASAAHADAQRATVIETATAAAAKLGLSNADAAVLFGVPEIASLPGKVVE